MIFSNKAPPRRKTVSKRAGPRTYPPGAKYHPNHTSPLASSPSDSVAAVAAHAGPITDAVAVAVVVVASVTESALLLALGLVLMATRFCSADSSIFPTVRPLVHATRQRSFLLRGAIAEEMTPHRAVMRDVDISRRCGFHRRRAQGRNEDASWQRKEKERKAVKGEKIGHNGTATAYR